MANDILRGDFNNIVIMQLRFSNTEVPIGKWVIWKEEIVMHKIGEDLYEVYPDVHPVGRRDLSQGYAIIYVDGGKEEMASLFRQASKIEVKEPDDLSCIPLLKKFVPLEHELLTVDPNECLGVGMTTWQKAKQLTVKNYYKEPTLKKRRHNIRSTLRR